MFRIDLLADLRDLTIDSNVSCSDLFFSGTA
jgi:hypothetical protein